MSGQNGLFRYGFETAEGEPYHDSTFARFETESLQMGRPYEPDPNLDPSGQETEGDALKAEGKGSIKAAPNTESWLRMRIQQRQYFEQTTPGVGVRKYVLRKAVEGVDTPIPFYAKSLWAGIWRDDGSEYNIMGARVSEFKATAPANKHLTFEHSLLFLRDRYMRNPTAQAVDAAYTGDMFARGHRQAGDELGDFYKFKVSTPGALDGTAKIVWGKGAAAYGATEYPVFADTWLTAFNADGTRAGTRREPIEVLFRPNVGDVLTLADEWHLPPTSPKPSASYSNRPKLTGVDSTVRFSLDGGTTFKSYIIKQFVITGKTPIEADFGDGSKYAQQIVEATNAKESWMFEFDRSYVDQDFLRALISGTRISVEATFYGAIIGSTAFEEYARYTMALTKSTLAGAVISTPGRLPEKVTLQGFSENNSPIMVEEYQNSVLSVTPTP